MSGPVRTGLGFRDREAQGTPPSWTGIQPSMTLYVQVEMYVREFKRGPNVRSLKMKNKEILKNRRLRRLRRYMEKDVSSHRLAFFHLDYHLSLYYGKRNYLHETSILNEPATIRVDRRKCDQIFFSEATKLNYYIKRCRTEFTE